MHLRRACAGLLPAILLLCASETILAAPVPLCTGVSSHISMESGSYSTQPGVTFVLHHFVATLVPMGTRTPSCLEKMTDVAHADIFVSNESLTRVFSQKLASGPGKLQELKIVHGFGTVTFSGVVVKLIPIHFSVEGPVSTDGTLLSVTADKIDADGVPIKMLLGLLGDHLSSVLGLKGVAGVQVNGNVLSFAPEEIAHLRGYIASVEATPQGLTLHYGRRPGGHPHTVSRLMRPTLPRGE